MALAAAFAWTSVDVRQAMCSEALKGWEISATCREMKREERFYIACADVSDRLKRELPEGFTCQWASKREADVAVVGIGRTGLGLWLLRTDEDGTQWGPALYLPEFVSNGETWHWSGHRSLRIDEGRLSFEVAGDGPNQPVPGDRSAQCTPITLATIPLAELARDTDGDGLSDHFELAIGLDPNNSDTDGDGIPDGLDPLPNVSARQRGRIPGAMLSQWKDEPATPAYVLRRQDGVARLTVPHPLQVYCVSGDRRLIDGRLGGRTPAIILGREAGGSCQRGLSFSAPGGGRASTNSGRIGPSVRPADGDSGDASWSMGGMFVRGHLVKNSSVWRFTVTSRVYR